MAPFFTSEPPFQVAPFCSAIAFKVVPFYSAECMQNFRPRSKTSSACLLYGISHGQSPWGSFCPPLCGPLVSSFPGCYNIAAAETLQKDFHGPHLA